jgi:hypothetical protein
MRVGSQSHAPAALPPGKRPDTHCAGGLVSPTAGMDVCGKSGPPGHTGAGAIIKMAIAERHSIICSQ